MQKMYNVIFEWDGNEEHAKDYPDMYVTLYDGYYIESRTYGYLKTNNVSPVALTLSQAIELMEAQNSGKFWDLFGYKAVICNAIEKTPTGYQYLDIGVKE